MDNRIYIFDTTLRDGEQTPGVNLNIQDKLQIAAQLDKLGVDIIEAGFPAASNGDYEAVKQVSAQVKNASVSGLCRALDSDIERAYDALKNAVDPRLHIFIATSDVHMKYKLKMSKEDVLQRAVNSVKFARTLLGNIEFSCEDGSRTEPEFLYRILEAVIAEGARIINIPDTVGYTTPEEFFQLIGNIRKNVPNIDEAVISVHCHNDLGMATANSFAGILAGARQVECTINGVGERAGNAALEEITMGLDTRRDFYGFTHGINTKRFHRTCSFISNLMNLEIPANKPIVGDNVFKHESGIHQHGVLMERSTYEIMTPESIGLSIGGITLGKLSGRHAFAEKLQQLGYSLDEEKINELFTKFKELSDRKMEFTDRDLEALLDEKSLEVPNIYEFESFRLQSGYKIDAVATVSLVSGGESKTEVALGDGPVDAAFKAIDKLVDISVKLSSYGIKAVTEGKDALGEVSVRVKHGEREFSGKGLSTDVIEASIRAYINAINRAKFYLN